MSKQFTTFCAPPTNWQSMPVHPLTQLASFFAPEHVEKLATHIRAHGYDQDESLILVEDHGELSLFDGVLRRAAAIEAGVVPTFKKFIGKSREAYIAKKALRQHLTESQRAMIAGEMATTTVGNPDKKKPVIPQICGITENTVPGAADALNVSERSVQNAKKVIASGTPELQEAVKDGSVSVSDAAAVATEPAAAQNEAVEAVKGGNAKTLKEAVANAKEPKPVTDAVGFPVPEKCLDAFAKVGETNALCRRLDDLVKDVEELGKRPEGKMQHTTSQVQTLQQVRKSLWGGRCTHVCPYCKGKNRKCNSCKDRGWVTTAEFKGAPEDLRKEMEAAK